MKKQELTRLQIEALRGITLKFHGEFNEGCRYAKICVNLVNNKLKVHLALNDLGIQYEEFSDESSTTYIVEWTTAEEYYETAKEKALEASRYITPFCLGLSAGVVLGMIVAAKLK